MARARTEERDRARARRAERGEAEPPVDRVELTDAVRSLKDNTQEETSEDRQERPQYGAGGRIMPRGERPPTLDLKG